MKYRYPLQKLVDLKANEKSHAEFLLSKAVVRLQEEQASLHRLHGERRAVEDAVWDSASGATTISELMQAQSYLLHLDQQIQRKHEDVLSAEQGVSRMQESLNGKVIEEKVWNKAKERAFDRFMTVVRKKEQDELDEIASVRRLETI